MIGRAGRAGQPSHSILFYSAAEMKGTTDLILRSLCDQKENCRRLAIIRALGSSELLSGERGLCCDVCAPVCPYKELAVPCGVVAARRRTVRKRALSPTTSRLMEKELISQRDALIERNPALKIFPKSVICPLSVIREICLRSRSIKSINDFQLISCVRPELHSPFFSVIVKCLDNEHHNEHAHISQ